MKKTYEALLGEIQQNLGYKLWLPLQKQAFLTNKEGFRNPQQNLFVIGDTSSGKTVIPIVAYTLRCMQLSNVCKPMEKMIYVVPYRALASQKCGELEGELHKIFSKLKIAISTGETREQDAEILRGEVDVAIIIYEKFCHFACADEGFLQKYKLVVLDEFSLLNSDTRGTQCDLALIYSLRARSRIIVLTTPYLLWGNYIHNGNFLLIRAEHDNVIPRKEIPIFLEPTGNHVQGKIVCSDETVGLPSCGNVNDIIEAICIHHLKQHHRILVFANNRQNVRQYATEIFQRIEVAHPELLTPCEKTKEECYESVLEEGGLLYGDLYNLMDANECYALYRGITYHNSSLGYELRSLIERKLFEPEGNLKIVFSTETMAYGINSNVDAVIIASMYKTSKKRIVYLNNIDKFQGQNEKRTRLLTVSEYQNYIGRAGRYGLCERGYAYPIIWGNKADPSYAEKIWSKFESRRNNIPKAVSAFENIDLACKKWCVSDVKKSCVECSLAANEAGMLILSLFRKGGMSKAELHEELKLLPGLDCNKDRRDFIINQSLKQLMDLKLIEKLEDPFFLDDQYRLRPSGKNVQGYNLTLYEYKELRRIVKQYQHYGVEKFDFFFELSRLPNIQNSAFDFLESNDGLRLYRYRKICCHELDRLWRCKQVSKDFYQKYKRDLDLDWGKGLPYPVLYRLLISMIAYLWHFERSVEKVSNALMVDGVDVVNVNPGRIATLSQEIAFYLQVLSSICGDYYDKRQLKKALDELELCFYFNAPKSLIENIEYENLLLLNRRKRRKLTEIIDYCQKRENVPPKTKREKREYRAVISSFQKDFCQYQDLSNRLIALYPILAMEVEL